ncbi:MAG: hypothetical protein AB7U45_03840 [Desulfamplus sp.]
MTVAARRDHAIERYPLSEIVTGQTYNITYNFLEYRRYLHVYVKLADLTNVTLVEGVDYSITVSNGSGGIYGVLTVLADRTGLAGLYIKRNIDASQTVTFKSDTLYSTTLENATDKLTMLIQDKGDFSTCVRVSEDAIIDEDGLIIPDATEAGGKVIGFNTAGTRIQMYETDSMRSVRQPAYEELNSTFEIPAETRTDSFVRFGSLPNADLICEPYSTITSTIATASEALSTANLAKGLADRAMILPEGSSGPVITPEPNKYLGCDDTGAFVFKVAPGEPDTRITNVFYVSHNGSDALTGITPYQAKKTIAGACAAAALVVPEYSACSYKAVIIIQGDKFFEDAVTIPPGVIIYAPTTDLEIGSFKLTTTESGINFASAKVVANKLIRYASSDEPTFLRTGTYLEGTSKTYNLSIEVNEFLVDVTPYNTAIAEAFCPGGITIKFNKMIFSSDIRIAYDRNALYEATQTYYAGAFLAIDFANITLIGNEITQTYASTSTFDWNGGYIDMFSYYMYAGMFVCAQNGSFNIRCPKITLNNSIFYAPHVVEFGPTQTVVGGSFQAHQGGNMLIDSQLITVGNLNFTYDVLPSSPIVGYPSGISVINQNAASLTTKIGTLKVGDITLNTTLFGVNKHFAGATYFKSSYYDSHIDIDEIECGTAAFALAIADSKSTDYIRVGSIKVTNTENHPLVDIQSGSLKNLYIRSISITNLGGHAIYSNVVKLSTATTHLDVNSIYISTYTATPPNNLIEFSGNVNVDIGRITATENTFAGKVFYGAGSAGAIFNINCGVIELYSDNATIFDCLADRMAYLTLGRKLSITGTYKIADSAAKVRINAQDYVIKYPEDEILATGVPNCYEPALAVRQNNLKGWDNDGNTIAVSQNFPAEDATVAYVSKTGNDANDGRTWAKAKLTIEAGCAVVPDGGTVYVGKGSYTVATTIDKNVTIIGELASVTVDAKPFIAPKVEFAASTDFFNVYVKLLDITLTNGALLWTRGSDARTGNQAHGDIIFDIGRNLTTNNALNGHSAYSGVTGQIAWRQGVVNCFVRCKTLTTTTYSGAIRPIVRFGGSSGPETVSASRISISADSMYFSGDPGAPFLFYGSVVSPMTVDYTNVSINIGVMFVNSIATNLLFIQNASTTSYTWITLGINIGALTGPSQGSYIRTLRTSDTQAEYSNLRGSINIGAIGYSSIYTPIITTAFLTINILNKNAVLGQTLLNSVRTLYVNADGGEDGAYGKCPENPKASLGNAILEAVMPNTVVGRIFVNDAKTHTITTSITQNKISIIAPNATIDFSSSTLPLINLSDTADIDIYIECKNIIGLGNATSLIGFRSYTDWETTDPYVRKITINVSDTINIGGRLIDTLDQYLTNFDITIKANKIKKEVLVANQVYSLIDLVYDRRVTPLPVPLNPFVDNCRISVSANHYILPYNGVISAARQLITATVGGASAEWDALKIQRSAINIDFKNLWCENFDTGYAFYSGSRNSDRGTLDLTVSVNIGTVSHPATSVIGFSASSESATDKCRVRVGAAPGTATHTVLVLGNCTIDVV